MGTGEVIAIEIVSVKEGHEEEARELCQSALAHVLQYPAVHRAWAIQDAQHPTEFAFVILLDAARVSETMREVEEAEWHKAAEPRWHEIMVRERFRRIAGPSLEPGA